MRNSDFKELIKGISSWAELEARIASLPTENERGEVFELFCHAFFILDTVFQFMHVYRQSEIPLSIRKRLGYPHVQDIGIDGLAVSSDDKLYAYQAKFRKDRNNTPTLRELSTFFTMSDKADWRIVITNANRLPSSINDRVHQGRILSDRLDKLDSDFFNRLRLYLSEKIIAPPKERRPHKTQRNAIDEAIAYFKNNSRGQLILPCGTGKTLTAMWIVEKFGDKKILVMVPSLALLSQTLREWAANTIIKPFRYLCLCSDTTVDLGNDSPVEHLYEMDVPVTTDAKVVADFLMQKSFIPYVLFSTYQSSKVLAEATIKTKAVFDIAIFDEAHRTTGTKVGIWNIALDNKNVPVKKRIFMTATPRIYAPHITKKAKENDVFICSMDDVAVYGKPFYEMTFGKAIEEKLIADYKVVVICVTDPEVRDLVKSSGRVITDNDHEWDAKAFAKRVALVKGINAYGLKKIFTFHGRVVGAKSFTDTTTPYGIHQVVELIAPKVSKKKNIKYFHVNGTMPSGVRNSLLQEFKGADIGIISNARCLTEGVDVPAVDTVAFIDPKRSLIDIVQATGRAMRKADWKERGYIFIPVIVEEDADPERFIESSDFDTVWKVLQAMLEQDQRLQDIVSHLKIMQGKGEEGTQAWKDAMAEYIEKIEFYDLPTKINQIRFINTLYTKTLEIIGRTWDFWYGLTLAYKKQCGDPNAPPNYKTPEGYNLGTWQVRQRQHYKKGNLPPDSIKRLEEIGFKWVPFEEAFEKGFQETLVYKERFGNPNAPHYYKTPNGYSLGMWQDSQRNSYKTSKLTPDRVTRLEKIGLIWCRFEEIFEKGFRETLRYKEQFGNANVPHGYKTAEDYELWKWQVVRRQQYKKGKLSPDRVKRLTGIEFKWDRFEEAFEKRFQETLRYKERFGNPNVPHGYKTPESYNLSSWQGKQRQRYKKGKLSSDRVKKLEAIGFKWELLEEAFEKGFRETLRYKERFGDPNTPYYYKTPEGYTLGIWQSQQRQCYKKGRLTSDRIKRLEGIGFKWELLDDTFEKGFQETLKYKEQFGDANAPRKYKTLEGFTLGEWQNHQRGNYREGKLTPDNVKRLEEIGLIWNRFEEAFEKGFRETLRYKEQFGNPNVPHGYKTPESYNLSSWQGSQRHRYKKGKLFSDRVKRLEEIGFKWDRLEEAFEKGFQETLRYKVQFGNPNAPEKYKTPEGYNLGKWQSHQKQHYKKGRLTPDKVKKLEGIGVIWELIEEAFEKGFQETLRYKERFGDPNVPHGYKAPESYNLGKWQGYQRQRYKKNKLTPDRVKRLEKIGFKFSNH